MKPVKNNVTAFLISHVPYHFYFAISGLATLIAKGSKSVKAIANNIQPKQPLDLKVNQNSTDIYCQGIHIGHAPKYINALLLLNPGIQWKIKADIVNHQDPHYADRIIAKVSLKSQNNIYAHRSFKPINKMPI